MFSNLWVGYMEEFNMIFCLLLIIFWAVLWKQDKTLLFDSIYSAITSCYLLLLWRAISSGIHRSSWSICNRTIKTLFRLMYKWWIHWDKIYTIFRHMFSRSSHLSCWINFDIRLPFIHPLNIFVGGWHIWNNSSSFYRVEFIWNDYLHERSTVDLMQRRSLRRNSIWHYYLHTPHGTRGWW